jgi:hypothetical protein
VTIGLVILVVAVFVFIVCLIIFAGRSTLAKSRTAESVVHRLNSLAKPHFQKGVLIAISVPVPTRLNFCLYTETDRTRSLRLQGRLTELQTGISAFDSRIFIECDEPKLAQWLGNSAQARALVLELVGAKRKLTLRGQTLMLSRPDVAPGSLTALAASLKALGEQVPRIDHLHPQAQAQLDRILWFRILAGSLLVMALGAGLQLMFELDSDPFPQHAELLPLMLAAGLFGAALGGVLHWYCLKSLRGSSWVPRIAAELVVTLWLPIIALSMLGARYVNLHGALEPEHEAVVRVDGLYSTRHRRSMSFHIRLGPIESANVPGQSYRSSLWLNERLAGIAELRVHWRRGRLGALLISRAPEPLSSPSGSR